MTSTTTSTELVRGLYDAFGRGDIAFILSRLAPDCQWIAPGEGLPDAGTYRGPEGAAEFFRKLMAATEVTRFEPREFFTSGNDVIALGVEEVRVIATGKTASTNWTMLFRVEDGLVTYFEVFYDTAAYLRAHQPA